MARKTKTAEATDTTTGPEVTGPEVVRIETIMLDPNEIVTGIDDSSAAVGIGRYKMPDESDILKLAFLMTTQGQLTNVEVYQTEDGRYHSVFGNTRIFAGRLIRAGCEYQAREIKDEEFKIRAVVVKGTPKQLFIRNLTENAARSELSVMDKAQNIRDAKDTYGLQGNQICELYSLDKSMISRYRKILELPGSVQDLIHAGNLGLSHGYALRTWNESSLTEEQMLGAIAAVGTERPSLTELETELRKIKPPKKEGDNNDNDNTPDKEPKTAGVTVKRRTLQDVLDMLNYGVISQSGSYPGEPNARQSKLLNPLFTNLCRYAMGDVEMTEEIIGQTYDKVATAVRKLLKEKCFEDDE